MPAARYWRIVAITPHGFRAGLALSEVGLYSGGTRVDAGATLGASSQPDSGALSALRDGSTASAVYWQDAPTFIQWDFGSSQSVDEIRVNSGASDLTSISGFALQSSGDGGQWATELVARSLPYSGASSSVDIVFPVTDPHFANVVLQVLSTTPGDASITDSSQYARTITAGTMTNSGDTYASEFASLKVGASGTTSLQNDANLALGAGDFTVELFVNPSASFPSAAWLINNATNWYTDPQPYGWGVLLSYGFLSLNWGDYSATATIVQGNVTLPTGVWSHVAFTRSGSTARAFVNGVLVGSATGGDAAYPMNKSTGTMTIGAPSAGWGVRFPGYLDEIRVTKGVCRYTDNFAPALIGKTFDGGRPRQLGSASSAEPVQRVVAFEPGPILFNFQAPNGPIDMQDGGKGRIVGTVKEKNTPSNTPLRRRVVLLNYNDQRKVRETWSDAATGVYVFDEIDLARKYTVISFDHTGAYRAVIADNLTPEVMT